MGHTEELQVMQWNACSPVAHTAELQRYVSTVDQAPQIICVQENKLAEGKNFNFPGYDVVRKDRPGNTAAGGVATLVKQDINFKIINVDTVIESIRVEIILSSGHKFVIVNVYCPP